MLLLVSRTCGSACRINSKQAWTSAVKVNSHRSIKSSSAEFLYCWTARLSTGSSIASTSWMVVRTVCSQKIASVTFPEMCTHLRLSCPIAAAVSSASQIYMGRMTIATSAPSHADRRATARPMPEVAPVIRARRPGVLTSVAVGRRLEQRTRRHPAFVARLLLILRWEGRCGSSGNCHQNLASWRREDLRSLV